MLHIADHRPALLGAIAANFIGATNYAMSSDVHAELEAVKLWLSVFAQGVGILSGLAAFAWYVYSYIKSKREDD